MNPTDAHTAYLNALFNTMEEAVLVIDKFQNIQAGNPAASKLFGLASSAVSGSSLTRLIPEGIPEKIIIRNKPLSIILNVKLAGGSLAPLRAEVQPIEGVSQWLLVLKKESLVKNTGVEGSFLEEKIKTKALLEAIPDTILMLNFKGDFMDHYPALSGNFPWVKADVIGCNIKDIFPVEITGFFTGAIDQIRKTKKPQHFEFRLENGNISYYEARLVPMNDHRVLTLIRDVTETLRNRRALKDEKSRLQNYMDSAASLFVVIKPDYRISLVNQKVCEVLGYTKEELLDKNWLSFLGNPSERKTLQILFDRAMKGKSKLSEYFERPIGTRTEKNRLIRWRNAILKDANGQVTGLICSGVDLTEQKAAEAELLESESRNRAILQAIPDVILLHDRGGKVLSIQASDSNQALFRPEKMEGRIVSELFPKETALQMEHKIRKCLEEQVVVRLEFSVDTKKERKYIEIRYVPLNNQQVMGVARDITQAKSIQQILNLRNRALEAAGNGILISDARMPDMPIIYCNEAFTTITGYPREEILGRNCRFLQGTDRDQKGIAVIRKALKKGKSSNVVIRNYRKDGSLFWNELTITPIFNGSGSPTHFIGVQNDISELIFEAKQKDHIRKILEAINQDLALEDVAGAIMEFVKSRIPDLSAHLALKLPDSNVLKSVGGSGMSKSLGHKLEYISLDETSNCPCQKANYSKKRVIFEDLSKVKVISPFIGILKKDGNKSSWSYPILSSDNKVLGTCTFFGRQIGKPRKDQVHIIRDAIQLASLAMERHLTQKSLEESKQKLEQYAKNLENDVAQRTMEVESTVKKLLKTNSNLEEQIHTRKEAEKRATASKVLFGAIAKNFPKGVIMVFDKDLKYVHLEGEELDRMGLLHWRFKEKSIMKTPGLSENQLADLKSKINCTLGGSHLSFELTQGTNVYAVNSTPLPLKDGTGQALMVFSNVTEHKKAEQELLRTLHIEQQLNELKSRFISMASHEFRTPLSAIHSSAILIGKQNGPGKEEKRLRYLNQIKKNVRNLVVILNDFLSLGKLEEGKIKYQPYSFDLLNLIGSVLEELESSLKVGQHFAEGFEMSALPVTLDPKLVRQILVNLLSNAIKYSPENCPIFIQIDKDRGYLKICIQDKGIGIPEEEQGQLFERFFRAGNAVNIPGTGLGLHIVKQYTELMGGNISFHSRLDEGSTFCLHLPIHPKTVNDEKNTDH